MSKQDKRKILVSACLLGHVCRYDGRKIAPAPEIISLATQADLLAFCPETAGGLPTPRAPAEICQGTGQDVLNKETRVVTCEGRDVSAQFIRGACLALELARREDITLALLKEKSPSCGLRKIYDGTFSKTLRPGSGVTAALLKQHGILVFSDNQAGQLFIHPGRHNITEKHLYPEGR